MRVTQGAFSFPPDLSDAQVRAQVDEQYLGADRALLATLVADDILASRVFSASPSGEGRGEGDA